jgi:hypothetical protein
MMYDYVIPDVPLERYDICTCGLPRFMHPGVCDGFVLRTPLVDIWTTL